MLGSSAYMSKKLSGMVSNATLKTGVPNAPQIHTMMNGENFVRILNPKEKYSWESFVKVTWDFLGSRREENTKGLGGHATELSSPWCKDISKDPFLTLSPGLFPGKSWKYQRGERFHQDIAVMETRRADIGADTYGPNMMDHYC